MSSNLSSKAGPDGVIRLLRPRTWPLRIRLVGALTAPGIGLCVAVSTGTLLALRDLSRRSTRRAGGRHAFAVHDLLPDGPATIRPFPRTGSDLPRRTRAVCGHGRCRDVRVYGQRSRGHHGQRQSSNTDADGATTPSPALPAALDSGWRSPGPSSRRTTGPLTSTAVRTGPHLPSSCPRRWLCPTLDVRPGVSALNPSPVAL